MPMIIRYRVTMELSRMNIAHIILCVFILFLIQEISGIATLVENDVIIVNRPIDVFFGRSVFIDPINDLRLHVRAGDTCMLTVLDNEQEISFKPGKLSLTNFDCNFGPEQISYTHFGGERAVRDVTRLLLRYDSVSQTLIIPFSLVVNIIAKPLDIVDKYNAITVTRHLGLSTPIGPSTIRFSDFDRNYICKISAISQTSGLPQYGYLTNNSHTLTNVDCEDFLRYGIRYKHHAQARGSNRDFIPLTVQLFHGNGDLKNQEFFQVPVDILSGHDNTPPEPSRTSTFVMDSINQFVMTAITPDIVSAVDDQSPNDKLLFNITLPLMPNEGIVVNTDNRNLPIYSFFQHEVNDLKIAYIPPNIDSNIKRLFQFELNIIDTDGLASDPLPMMIVVSPMSTKAPVVTKNTGIQLVEGQLRPIKSPEVLVISDEDNLKDVKISHIDGLKHGHLVLPPGKKYFTVKDLEAGTVVYHHDDSDSYSDNIIFHMTDGNSDVQFLFPVTIYPKDDRHPTLNVNTGLELRKNDIVEINQFVLSATDTDTNDLSILFTIEASTSKLGIIVKRQFQIPDDVENWHFKDGVYEQSVSNFLQKDILEGKIFYRHVGDHISDVVTDKIHFTLSDSGTPPNISPRYELVVKIHPVDDIPPYLYPNTQLYMEVEESQMVHFRRRSFRYADEDTNDREILFTITRPPYDTYTDGPSDAGAVVHCDDYRRVMTQFQQSEINHQKLCYLPPSVELGLTTRIVKFDFSVEDNSGNILPDQSYTIVIKPVNNQPPVVRNSGAMVVENDVVRITKEMLDVTDKDTEPKHIIIIVRTIPNYGILYKESDILAVGNKFKQDDIDRGKIFYRNTGENVEVLEDNFSLDVSDGIHFIPITFRIRIQPIDDEPAYLEGSGSAGVLDIRLNVDEKSSVTIRPSLFTIRDPDSDVMAVTYVIQKYPEHGTIYKNGVRVSHFTQRDIWLGHVTYEHNKAEIGLREVLDQVTLSIYNNDRIVLQDGTRLVNIHIHFTVLPVNDFVPVVRLGPSLNVLEGNRTLILPKHIDVKDDDTVEDEILCIITEQPQHGFISNKAPRAGSERSRESLPVSAFDVKNLRNRNIMYVQSVHKGVEPRTDQFLFYCTDGMNLSVEKRVDIDITPTNDEEPEVFIREFIGSEGMEIRIDSPILNAIDKDEPPEILKFIITKQPANGKIFQQTRDGDIIINNFTLGDIEKFSTIIYQHDDSETQSDYFEFILTDGLHSLSRSVPIIIFPVDDEPPRLAINNGLDVENLGDHKRITNKELKAEDVDSFEGNITYIIRLLPQQGFLVRDFGRGRSEHNLTLWSNFTQSDIDEGRITYVHTGTEAKRDLLKFEVTDGLNPLIDRNFYITIKGMDIIYPEVINKGIELPEGGMVLLTTDMISATDSDTPDEKLTYTITKTPQHGYVEFVDRAGHPIVSFTQLDLAANRVRYVHNSEYEIKMDSFEFEVTDGFNPVYRTFRIALTDVDNKNPVLMYTVLRLKEGTNETITPFELKAVDMDTPDEKIVFTITQVPLHGNLLYNFSRIVSRFTLKDLKENLISYQHDGSDTMSDSFIFTVTDGTHVQFYIPGSNLPTRKPQEMDIEIIPVDNGLPHVSVNSGAHFLTAIDVGLGFTLTRRNLYSEDQDSDNDELEYSITVTPNHGYLRNIEHGNDRITSWTQGDINEQKIQYVLNPGENATSDSFFFQVSDKGGNSLKNQPFHLNWGWISFRQSKITVNETEEILEVTLLRRGYLSETSFVTINVTERTANIGKDVALQFAEQVQFNPGQTEKSWRLPIRDDNIYEKEETLVLQMTDPVSAVLEYPEVAMVTIVDPEDESVVFFPEKIYNIEEKIGELEIPIHRTGDLSNELMVVCYTIEGTARGTPPNKMQSYSDYLSRPEDHSSMVRFDKGEDKKMCTVTIIDDSLFEEEETFSLMLGHPMGGRVGTDRETTVVIGPDPADEPKFYFDQSQYEVDESSGTFKVKVWKTGTDLSRPSSVTVKSRQLDPVSAEAGVDYVPVVRILDFLAGEMTQTLDVTILDDLGHPVLEGLEKFELLLRMPVGGSLGEPSVSMVTINDSLSDLPKMEFLHDQYDVQEKDNEVVAMVTRSGDLSTESYVRCYTRQASALVDEDYIERPNTNASFVVFKPNKREAECRVEIINDKILEGEESFRLVLGTPDSPMTGGATLGGQVTTKILITDDEDKPVIKFEKTIYTVNEPIIKGDITTLSIPVIRQGDTTSLSEVRISTKSGSATAMRDFNPKSTVLRFTPGTEKLYVDIEINYDNKSENSESFSVHLSQDLNNIAEVHYDKRATIYIEENSQLADVIFPVQPLIVSLRDYDRVEQSINRRPINGYPLICISPCNPRHPKYKDVKRTCKDEGIDDSMTKYRWRVGSPRDKNGVYGYIRDLETNTVFTKARYVTLDSIYFTRGSQVQCYARAVNSAGEPGMEVGSSIIIVDEQGMCPPRRPDAVGAEPFTAKVHYTGADDTSHPNKIKLSIQAPHTDGVLPIISTRRLSNFWLALSADAFRQEHPCSNLLDVHELATNEGFITNETRKSIYIDDAEPYEFDNKLRPNSTLRFYKNLDLESCVWTFVAYFDMSELIRPCMGVVETDAQVLNIKQSYVSLKVPLFVSYVYYPTLQPDVWRNFDQRTELRLRFVYNTAILWQEGISAHVQDTDVQARLYPVSMRVQEDGKLIVNFRTVANFRGQFLPNSPGGTLESTVTSLNHPNMEFKLRLIRSDSTYDQPEQLWEFTSLEARQDFSGDFKVNLVPCYASLTQSYTLQPECSYGNLMTFDLPIRFQQVNDPVAAKFSLNTEFFLIRKRDLWLSESLQGLSLREEDTAFAPGDTIYGRINVDPVQSLGNEFLLTIDKVYLCSGKDGYIPKYDPDSNQYGCIGNTDHLESVFRIVDAEAPYTTDKSYQGSSFNAILARDDMSARNLVDQAGVDGFSFDSKPLFQVDSGKQWFLHAIYAIKSRNNNNNVIQKRSVHSLVVRSLNDASDIGNGEIGTNMVPLLLDFDGKAFNNETFKSDKVAESNLGHTPLLAALISVGILLLTGIFVLVICITHRRKRTSPPPTPSGTITVMSTQTGQTRVISNAHIFKPNDHSEV